MLKSRHIEGSVYLVYPWGSRVVGKIVFDLGALGILHAAKASPTSTVAIRLFPPWFSDVYSIMACCDIGALCVCSMRV